MRWFVISLWSLGLMACGGGSTLSGQGQSQTELSNVVCFYVTRDNQPGDWLAGDAFDDIPAALGANVNVTEAPDNRRPGQAPALNASENEDLVAFLHTLTDGYTP